MPRTWLILFGSVYATATAFHMCDELIQGEPWDLGWGTWLALILPPFTLAIGGIASSVGGSRWGAYLLALGGILGFMVGILAHGFGLPPGAHPLNFSMTFYPSPWAELSAGNTILVLLSASGTAIAASAAMRAEAIATDYHPIARGR